MHGECTREMIHNDLKELSFIESKMTGRKGFVTNDEYAYDTNKAE